MTTRIPVFPLHVSASEAQGIATKEIFEGMWRPDDISSATTVFAPSLEHLPVWRIAVETTGFHIGLGGVRMRRYRGPVSMTVPTPDIGVGHHADDQLIVAHRHFPLAYLPQSSLLRFDPAAMASIDQASLEGTVLPVDVTQAEAEHEVIASVMRRVAPETALFKQYDPKVSTSFAYVPLYIVRYAYQGSGRRHPNEEFFLTICGQRGTILAKHHPAGAGLVGALGRILVGPTYSQPAAPQPRPPWNAWSPPPAPPPPTTTTTKTNEAQPTQSPTQVLAIASTISLVEARARISHAVSEARFLERDAKSADAPLLVHVPFWRIRIQRASAETPVRATNVLTTRNRAVFVVPAIVNVAANTDELAPLMEIAGFHAPEMTNSRSIAPVERRSLEAGAILLDADVSRDVAVSSVLKATTNCEPDVASARLIHYPLYIQRVVGGSSKTKKSYVVISGVTGAVLGARLPMAMTPLAPITPRETAAASV